MGVAMTANTKDVSAGLLFIAIAALFALGTQELELGTARKLGPGAFPLMLSGVLGAARPHHPGQRVPQSGRPPDDAAVARNRC